ncbi:MAG: CDP-alcohol phosphatidyltransferase family protein [Simkaniaceae bacterium]|nr:CDP-alcohol phosphatidyltransferase family protein [Simkaniaceae bacterium]
MMINPPNSISFLRAPLALLFIIENTTLRTVIIILAMLSDCVDGYLARRYQITSRFGAILDPLMDKFFVYVTLAVLLFEKQILPWQAATMLSRDFFLMLFLSYLGITGTWRSLEVKAIRWGKVTTAAQFCILIALVLKIPFPPQLFFLFILFGCLAFVELLQFKKQASCN